MPRLSPNRSPGRAWLALALAAVASPAAAAVPPDRASPDGAVVAADSRPAAPPGDGRPSPAPGETKTSPPLRELPLESRDPVAAAVENAPGANLTGVGPRLRGGHAANLTTLLNGFRLYYLRPPLSFLDGAEVLPSGYGAALGDVPEGAIAWRSLAPRGRLATDVEYFREARSYVKGGVAPDAPAFAPSPGIERRAEVVSAGLGGRLFEDRLRVNAVLSRESGEIDPVEDIEGIFPPAPPPAYGLVTGALAASWRATAHQSFDALALLTTGSAENGENWAVAPEAQPRIEGSGFMVGLGWAAALHENVALRMQASWERSATEQRSALCASRPGECEEVPAKRNLFPRQIQTGNRTQFIDDSATRRRIEARLQVRAGRESFVHHELTLWSQVENGSFEKRLRAPGDELVEFNGTVPQQRTETFANDPRIEPPRLGWSTFSTNALRLHHGIEDQLRIGRQLTVRPGVGVLTSRVRDPDGSLVLDDTALTLHLGGAWNVRARDTTFVTASTSRRFAPLADGTLPRLPETQVSRTCGYDAATNSYSRDCVFSGGAGTATVGRPCSPSGLAADGRPCTASPKMPETWEHTVGLQQALSRWAGFAVDLVYRKTQSLPIVSETNRVWNATGTATMGFRNGRPETVYDYSTADQAWRRYLGGTIALHAQGFGLTGRLAYTYSRQEIQAPPAGGNPWGDTPGAGNRLLQGFDADDRLHSVRAIAHYALFDFASVGVTYAFDSGAVLAQRYRNVGGGDENYRASRGISPGVDINDPADDREQRFPHLSRLNLQARVRLEHWIPFGLDGYLDVLNAFNDPYLGAGNSPGRWLRFGLEGRY